jgi:histidine decarboxylase
MVAEYAEQRFIDAGIAAWRNPTALTVVIPQPAAAICAKWQLASSHGISHVICMPHITRQKIDELLKDMLGYQENAA